jgi:hypothetical protein
MKLARPDVFHPRIVLAGCAALPEGDGDDAELVVALRRRGLHARWLSWDDPATLEADLVILRATWDYIDRLDEFLDWTTKVPNLANAPEVVVWNVDKRYLADLAEAGVPVIPSRFFAPGEGVTLPSGELVVKPAVGAGSVGAQRFSDSDEARAHVAALHADGRTALVQPYDGRVEDGETALVFLGGRQSHAFTKGPILPSPGSRPAFDDSGTYAEESLTPAELLYARVDLIGGPTDPKLLELELVEPSLGWRQLDAATRSRRQRDFVVGVEDTLERRGLGPLSHRRP